MYPFKKKEAPREMRDQPLSAKVKTARPNKLRKQAFRIFVQTVGPSLFRRIQTEALTISASLHSDEKVGTNHR